MDAITTDYHLLAAFPEADSGAMMSNQQMALLGLVVGATILVMISTRRRLRASQNTPRAYTRAHVSRLKEEKHVLNEVSSVMLQLDELSREITGQIDTRFAKLEKSIRDADARIETIKRLLQDAGSKAPVEEGAPKDKAPTESDGRYGPIHEMNARGLSLVDIAQQSGKTTGEVELIIALGRNKQHSGEPYSDEPPSAQPSPTMPQHRSTPERKKPSRQGPGKG